MFIGHNLFLIFAPGQDTLPFWRKTHFFGFKPVKSPARATVSDLASSPSRFSIRTQLNIKTNIAT